MAEKRIQPLKPFHSIIYHLSKLLSFTTVPPDRKILSDLIVAFPAIFRKCVYLGNLHWSNIPMVKLIVLVFSMCKIHLSSI